MSLSFSCYDVQPAQPETAFMPYEHYCTWLHCARDKFHVEMLSVSFKHSHSIPRQHRINAKFAVDADSTWRQIKRLKQSYAEVALLHTAEPRSTQNRRGSPISVLSTLSFTQKSRSVDLTLAPN